MKLIIYISLILIVSCGQQSETSSDIQTESVTSREVSVKIPQGSIKTLTSYPPQIKKNIAHQMRFLVGPFASAGGTPDLGTGEIDIQSVEKKGDLYDVRYTVTFKAILPKTYSLPETKTLPLPVRGDLVGTADFYDRYYRNTRYTHTCTTSTTNRVVAGNFWYYFRPMRSSCPLREVLTGLDNIQWVKVQVSAGEKNSTNKHPEYGEMWEDGRLAAVVLIGKESPGGTSAADAGVSAFLQFYRNLVQWLGKPVETSLGSAGPSADTPHIKARFEYLDKKIDLDLFLVNSMASFRQRHLEAFNQLSAKADFVGYSGHSGLGEEVEQFMNIGQTPPGKYQLYLINACSSFAYKSRALEERFAKINPGQPASKYLDMVMNTMPGYFRNIAHDNLQLISSLVRAEENYYKILTKLSGDQNMIVIGEQDNLWPAPFHASH